jgi:hypothetical protein
MPSAATGGRYPLSVHEALRLQLTNGRNQSTGPGVCGSLARSSTAYPSPAGRFFPVKCHRAIMAALLAAALFQSEHLRPHTVYVADRDQLLKELADR